MAAPTIINTKTTTATKYGGDALNNINNLLNGQDVTSEIGTPIIRTPIKIPSNVLKFTDPAEDNTVIVKIANLSENKTINLVPTNVEADDEVLYRTTVQEVEGKVISAGTNTITDLTNANLSGSAGITDPNLAQITDKSKLPSTAVYTTDSQTLENKAINLTNNTVTDTSRSLGDLVKDNGTKYARFPRGTDTQVLKSDATDVVWGAVAYTELTDIPTEFTPEAHDHDADYSPLGHLHAYADITDKPTEFTPEAHNHAASEITSGTLAVAQGGTNKATITEHSLLKGGAANTYSEIAPGTDGKIIKMVSGIPAWADESGGTLTDVNNVGTGTGLVFRDIATDTINLKTIKAGANVTITNDADDVTINSSGGEGGGSMTADSLGTGEGEVFKEINLSEMRFRSLKQGTNVQLSQDANEITVAAVHNHDAVYSALGHVHSYASITDKPTEFTPSAHNHSGADITSGTVGVTRGGTGKATYSQHALLKGGASNAYTEIAVGTTNQVLAVVDGTPAWKSLDNETVGLSQGTGGSTVYEITHGMGAEPTYVFIDCMSHSTGRTWTKDTTKITVTFDSVVDGGADAVKIMWKAIL